MKTFQTALLGLERIFSISHEIITNPSLEDILHSIVQVAAEVATCEIASIMLLDPASNTLNFVVSTQHTDQLFDLPVPIEHSIGGAAFTHNHPVIVHDALHDPRYYPKVDELLHQPAPHSIVAVPLTFREHKIGVLEVIDKRQGQFDEADVEVLVVLAAQATITIEIARLYRQAQAEIAERIRVEEELRRHQDHLEELVKERTAEVHSLAITDSLTGLFNRRHLMLLGNQSMQQAQRYHSSFTAMMMDVDHFKKINDTYGHATGDEALRRFAEVLRQDLRSADIAGRYGGDEFVVLMPNTDLTSACELANRLLRHIRGSWIDTVEGQIGLTASIGMAEINQTHPQTLDTLLDKADRAVYAAKRAGRNQVFVGNTGLLTPDE